MLPFLIFFFIVTKNDSAKSVFSFLFLQVSLWIPGLVFESSFRFAAEGAFVRVRELLALFAAWAKNICKQETQTRWSFPEEPALSNDG